LSPLGRPRRITSSLVNCPVVFTPFFRLWAKYVPAIECLELAIELQVTSNATSRTPPASSTHQARNYQPSTASWGTCVPLRLRLASPSRTVKRAIYKPRSTSARQPARRATPQVIRASIRPILLDTTQQYTGGKATPPPPLLHLPSHSAYLFPGPFIHAAFLVIAEQDPRAGASIPTSNLHADNCKTQDPRIDLELIGEMFYAALSAVLQ
jgi:hypothetical protein